jgi:hypothetical protein
MIKAREIYSKEFEINLNAGKPSPKKGGKICERIRPITSKTENE